MSDLADINFRVFKPEIATRFIEVRTALGNLTFQNDASGLTLTSWIDSDCINRLILASFPGCFVGN